MSTAPYRDTSRALISGPHRQEMLAQVIPPAGAPFALPFETASVTFDEDWSPHAQATITGPAPTAEQIEALDARGRVKVKLTAGYLPELARADVQELATLNLRGRPISRPDNKMNLSLQGDELYAQDNKHTGRTAVVPDRTGIAECIQWLLGRALVSFQRTYAVGIPAAYRPDLLEDLVIEPGDSWFDAALDVADRAGVRVWCNPAGVWQIDVKPAYTDSVHDVVEGGAGTLLEYQATLEREPWYNSVLLDYQFTKDGTNRRILGTARVSAGPLGTVDAGAKVYVESRRWAVSQASANAAAANLCAALATRGRSLELEAISAYWIRPGRTIIVSNGNGPRERWIVSRVTFNFPAGRMSLKCRQPGNITITSGE